MTSFMIASDWTNHHMTRVWRREEIGGDLSISPNDAPCKVASVEATGRRLETCCLRMIMKEASKRSHIFVD